MIMADPRRMAKPRTPAQEVATPVTRHDPKPSAEERSLHLVLPDRLPPDRLAVTGGCRRSLMALQRLAGNRAVAGLARATTGAAAETPLTVAREPDDDARIRRRQQKAATQERRRQRATAGKDLGQLSDADVERQLSALEREYRRPGANQRSMARKAADLERFRRLLWQKRMSTRDRVARQFHFDELQRTPPGAEAQGKHVAGHKELPGMDLQPGRDRYAQPDYSVTRRNKDGTLEVLRINLKSHNLLNRTPAQARAVAKDCVKQAISNAANLSEADTIVVSFAQRPSEAVQTSMNRIFFQRGSPVREVRFGSATFSNPHLPARRIQPPVPTPAARTGPAEPVVLPPAAKPAVAPTGAGGGSTITGSTRRILPKAGLKAGVGVLSAVALAAFDAWLSRLEAKEIEAMATRDIESYASQLMDPRSALAAKHLAPLRGRTTAGGHRPTYLVVVLRTHTRRLDDPGPPMASIMSYYGTTIHSVTLTADPVSSTWTDEEQNIWPPGRSYYFFTRFPLPSPAPAAR